MIKQSNSTAKTSDSSPFVSSVVPSTPAKVKPVQNESVCELKVLRKWFDDEDTIGELYINGIFFCYTLEDTVRALGVKISGKTAIPAGKYKVILDMSTRFKKIMPHILDVKNFEGIRIHTGNVDEDTEGCLLVGLEKELIKRDGKDLDRINDSRSAFDKFFPILQKASSITIEIVNQRA